MPRASSRVSPFASEDLAIRIAEDGCILVEGGLHIGPSARLRTIGIILDRLGNRVVLVQIGGRVHGFHSCTRSARFGRPTSTEWSKLNISSFWPESHGHPLEPAFVFLGCDER